MAKIKRKFEGQTFVGGQINRGQNYKDTRGRNIISKATRGWDIISKAILFPFQFTSL